MLQRFFSVITLASVLATLVWWSGRLERKSPAFFRTPATDVTHPNRSLQRHQQLIETLDRLVAAEREYRRARGHYTKILSRLSYSIPTALADHYGFSVQEASADRLLISAFSEQGGAASEFITIDHDFQLRANFSLPPPRSEYLRLHALNHLESLRRATGQGAQLPPEHGVYGGYFRYELQRSPRSRAVATGMRPPVAGLELEMRLAREDESEEDSMIADLLHKLPSNLARAGEKQRQRRDLAGDLEIEPIESE